MKPRVVVAPNPGPFTLDGTRTHIVGRKATAIIDPGPNQTVHLNALRRACRGTEAVVVLVTHDHPDHSEGARTLAEMLGASLLGACRDADRHLDDGEEVATDHGTLVAVHTPGHAREHLCFHWPRTGTLFVGDLMLGQGTTTWIGEYPGCVADYLASLDRVESLAPDRIYPAHGSPVDNAGNAIRSYRRHRLSRIEQVRRAEHKHPGSTPSELATAIYGPELPLKVHKAAALGVRAMLDHLRACRPSSP